MKKLAWVAVVVWMFLIFYLSNQPAYVSNELSQGVAKVVAQNIEFVSSSEDFNFSSFNSLVRKNAHFFLYFILGIIVVSTLKKFGVTGVKGIMLSVLICVGYAISDEWHQLFVPGRGAQMSDVMIDSSGAIIGILLTVGVGWLMNNKSKRIASVK